MLLIRLKSTDNHPDVEDIKAKYNKVKPRALGALFSVIAGVLEKLGKAMSEELIGVPEMSDYARRLKAADMAFPGLVLATQVGGQARACTRRIASTPSRCWLSRAWRTR